MIKGYVKYYRDIIIENQFHTKLIIIYIYSIITIIIKIIIS